MQFVSPFFFWADRCIGRWLAERSATCPLCKTELWDEEEESSDEEEEPAAAETAQPGSMNWRQFLNMMNFDLEGGSENLVTATANNSQQPQQQQAPQPQQEDFSSEPNWWRRWLLQRRGRRRHRTLAEEHGVTLTALSEPLLQAENGQIENHTNLVGEIVEPRPDPPEGGAVEQE